MAVDTEGGDASETDEVPETDEVVPPDESEPGRLRAELLAMLERGAAPEEMWPVARERREVLRAGWLDDQEYGPGAFFHPTERELFADSIRPMLEERVLVAGTIRQTVIDYDDHHEEVWSLESPVGVHAVIGPVTSDLPVLEGHDVEGEGWRLDEFVMVEQFDSLGPALAFIAGERRVLAIVAQLTPQSTPAVTEAQIRERLVEGPTSSHAFYELASRDVVQVSVGAVAGPYPLYDTAPGSVPCDYNAWANTLINRAMDAGYNIYSYDHVMYFIPWGDTTVCRWAGLGQKPGTRTWIRGGATRTISHELGHNFGMHHAGQMSCSGNPLPASTTELSACQSSPTSDPNDVMAYTHERLLNAAHQIDMQWLGGNDFVDLGVAGRGTYTLRPLYGDVPGTRILHYFNQLLSETVAISYRTPRAPFDQGLFTGGVEIHLSRKNDAGSFGGDTVRVQVNGAGALTTGGEFWDRHSGLHVRQLEQNDQHARVEVAFMPSIALPQAITPEHVEAVVEGNPGDGPSILTIYHEPTGQTPAGSWSDAIGRQHTRLIARVTRGEPVWETLAPQALSEPPAFSEYAPRGDHHAAAVFDPSRGTFVVASTRLAQQGFDADGNPAVRASIMLHEVEPNGGGVSLLANVDLGTFWENGVENPFYINEPEIQLVRAGGRYVLVMSRGGNVINVRGNPLVLGTFELPDSGPVGLNGPSDLALRLIPGASQAKWPSLEVGEVGGQEVVAIAWTDAVGPLASNRIAVLGYNPASDVVFSPADVSSGQPLLVDIGIDAAGTNYDAFRPDLGFDPDTGRFHAVFTYRGEAYNWEILRRSFRLQAGAPAELDAARRVSLNDAQHSFGGQVGIDAQGNVVTVHQDDNLDFFDGQARTWVAFTGSDGVVRGTTSLHPGETAFSRPRLAVSASSNWVYVLRGGIDGVHLDAIRLGN